jgi:hypothetical protein
MRMQRQITFVVNSNNREILQSNLLASTCLQDPHSHQVIVQEGYSSASQAYNDAIDKSKNDLMVFIHQDVILPESWLSDLERALSFLDTDDPQWGVLGTYGLKQSAKGGARGYVYSSGRGIIGEPFEKPAVIQTLDEIVLIVRKSSGLRFDDALPHFHFYGTDICFRAKELGMNSYAISAFCIHNTHQSLVLPKEFYDCCSHIRRKWSSELPIYTTCAVMTESNAPVVMRRLRELYLRLTRRNLSSGMRREDVPRLVEEVDAVIRRASLVSSTR